MNPYRLTDPIPGEPWHKRARRESQARATASRPKRRKPRPLPKGWEPPF